MGRIYYYHCPYCGYKRKYNCGYVMSDFNQGQGVDTIDESWGRKLKKRPLIEGELPDESPIEIAKRYKPRSPKHDLFYCTNCLTITFCDIPYPSNPIAETSLKHYCKDCKVELIPLDFSARRIRCKKCRAISDQIDCLGVPILTD